MTEIRDTRRARVLRIAWVAVPALFQGMAAPGWLECETPIPADLTVLDVRVDHWKQDITLLVASASFEVVASGADPPEWALALTRHDKLPISRSIRNNEEGASDGD